jgi:S-adenosylmethionine:tRNA ribosyltransferase-isomerase
VKTTLFDYELPDELIARRPLERRDAARLLVLRREGVQHSWVSSLPELVPEGALVVLNETRVVRSRLFVQRRGSGGRVELLFLRCMGRSPTSEAPVRETWQALGRASKALRPGSLLEADGFLGEVLERADDGVLRLEVATSHGLEDILERSGHVPIPPYLGRADEPLDGERYQTVFAREAGSSAAPTAGLHLTEAMLQRFAARGIAVGRLVLHIGLDTFRPVTTDDLDQHAIHTEEYSVDERLAAEVREARARGGKVIAVGTTVVRALESARDPSEPRLIRPGRANTTLFIQPGYDYRVVDALFTNFHMPRSTLLALVSAFAGRERLLAAYAVARSEGYRFLSYGDAMWIPERLT